MVDNATLLGYQLRLPSFEGPLDVLLRLIERSHLSITDISLVAVTDQFLAYVATLDEAEPSFLAEFAAVGARLVLLKSRSLLPRPPVSDDLEATSDLARELIEYRAVKAAAQEFSDRHRAGLGTFARSDHGIAAPAQSIPIRLAMHEASSLARAVRRRLAVAPTPRALFETARVVTLREMVERMLTMLDGKRQISFQEYSRSCADSAEIRAGFLAMLILIRRRVIDADQRESFGDIIVTPGAAATATVSGVRWEEE